MLFENRKPDFEQLLAVLRCDTPDRPTPFEFHLNNDIGRAFAPEYYGSGKIKNSADGFAALTSLLGILNYDYSLIMYSNFGFPTGDKHQQTTLSLNEGVMISDRESFEKYDWLDPKKADIWLDKAAQALLPGMKLVIFSPSGVLENTINLVGYDNLCFMLMDDPELLKDIFDKVGSSLYTYYEIALDNPAVGAVVLNDDWGFNTQTFLSPPDMRKYVFPWHKKMTDLAHSAGRPVILHSCGKFSEVIDDIYEIGYEGRHSYEDNIMPVEKAYEFYNGKIATMGGIDVDFIINSSETAIRERCMNMLEITKNKGGFALGSGNSIPGYVPTDKYLAMHKCIEG